jgi:hypothetical protein
MIKSACENIVRPEIVPTTEQGKAGTASTTARRSAFILFDSTIRTNALRKTNTPPRGINNELIDAGILGYQDLDHRLGHTGLRSFTDEHDHFWLEQNPAKNSK